MADIYTLPTNVVMAASKLAGTIDPHGLGDTTFEWREGALDHDHWLVTFAVAYDCPRAFLINSLNGDVDGETGPCGHIGTGCDYAECRSM